MKKLAKKVGNISIACLHNIYLTTGGWLDIANKEMVFMEIE